MRINEFAMSVGKPLELGSPQTLHIVQLAGIWPALPAKSLTAAGLRLPFSCEIPRAIGDRPAAIGAVAIARLATMRKLGARRIIGRIKTPPDMG